MNAKIYKSYQEQKAKRNESDYKSIEEINEDIIIRRENGQSVKDVSDKYHTFKNYTDFRNAWCMGVLMERPDIAWKSLRHYDEINDPISDFNGDFIAGINTPKGPVAQHMKLEHWDSLNIPELDHAPEYDGYTMDDSIERIKSLYENDSSIDNYLGLIELEGSLISKTSNDIEEIYSWFSMYPDTNQVLLHNRKELDLMFEKYKDTKEVNVHRYYALPEKEPNYILGYDCDGREIYEYQILRTVWSSDIDMKEIVEKDSDADPRQYCALYGVDGKAYAISVYNHYPDLIRKREHLSEDEEIPTIIKPIEEMGNYEVATICCGEGDNANYDAVEYEFDRNKLKRELNEMIMNELHGKVKKISK